MVVIIPLLDTTIPTVVTPGCCCCCCCNGKGIILLLVGCINDVDDVSIAVGGVVVMFFGEVSTSFYLYVYIR